MTIQITPAILPSRNLPVEMIRYFVLVAMDEALRRNITASALFKELWQDFQGRSK